MGINTVALSGNLTRDPEVRETQSGKSVCSIRLGSKGYGDKSIYTDITLWDKLAELVGGLSKGAPLTVAGRLEYDEWTDKEGNKRSALKIVANDVQLPPREQVAQADDDIDF